MTVVFDVTITEGPTFDVDPTDVVIDATLGAATGPPGPGVPRGTEGDDDKVPAWVGPGAYDYELRDAPGGGASSWGDLDGNIADQTDLQAELDAKANTADLGTAAAADAEDFDEAGAAAAVEAQLAGYQPTSEKGQADGYAELDGTGRVPPAQLPSYVDDVVEAANFAALPGTGETGKVYVTLDDNLTYRWSGSAYVEISASLALGETSGAAYRGDRGKTAYDHSQQTSGNPHGVTKADVGLGNVTNDEQIPKSIVDANTILKADADNTPEALVVPEQRLVGRLTGGEIDALTIAQVRTLLGTQRTNYTPTLKCAVQAGSASQPTLGAYGEAVGDYQIDPITNRCHVAFHIKFFGSGASAGSGAYLVSVPVPIDRGPIPFDRVMGSAMAYRFSISDPPWAIVPMLPTAADPYASLADGDEDLLLQFFVPYSLREGSVTFASGETSKVITHNLGYTPLARDVTVTPRGASNATNNTGPVVFDTAAASATQMTLRTRDPGASGLVVDWKIRAEPRGFMATSGVGTLLANDLVPFDWDASLGEPPFGLGTSIFGQVSYPIAS